MAIGPAMDALKAYAEANLTELPVAFNREGFTPPPEHAPWALVRVISGLTGIAGIGTPGSRLIEQDGLLHILVHVKKGTVWERGAALADEIAAKFETIQLPAPANPAYVRTQMARVDPNAAGDLQHQYDVILVSVPFVLYQFR